MTEESADERVAALERRLVEIEQAHRATLLRAGLRAEATRAGMIDMDGLKLVDSSEVTLDDNGELVGATTLMASLRRSKPWLFGLAGPSHSTSSAAVAPPAQAPRPRRATDMTHDEWQAARAELLRRI